MYSWDEKEQADLTRWIEDAVDGQLSTSVKEVYQIEGTEGPVLVIELFTGHRYHVTVKRADD